MLRQALRLLLVLALCFAPALGSADVFRWVDELGVTHYTTDPDTIPRRFRASAKEIVATPRPGAARRASRRPAEAATTAPTASSPESVPAVPSAPGAVTSTPAPASRTIAKPAAGPVVFPGPPTTAAISPGDPRAAELAELEAQIATDRESLRQMISTKRWDSAELASDPGVREIAERLPRLQAELEALRAETVP